MAQVAPDSPLRRQPQVRDVALDSLPKAELLGTPEVRVLLGYTRRLLRLHDGHTFAVFSFSSSAPANWLFLIDGRDLSVARYDIPNNDVGSHGAALGADGNIYLMPYGNGRVHRFDVETRRFESHDVELPKSEYTWGAVGASNGRVYFGTYPSASLGEYDIATRKLRVWKQIAPNTKYVVDLNEDEKGNIRCRATGPDEVWMTFDPEAGELRRGSPYKPSRHSTASLAPAPLPEGDTAWRGLAMLGRQRFAVGHPRGRLWEIDPDGSLTMRAETEAFAEPSWWLETVDDAVVGISYFGVTFRYNTKTGDFTRKQIPNSAPGGNGLMFIESVAGKWIIGANYSQQNLFRMDVETGEVEQPPWIIARTTGEPMCVVGFGDRAYLGIYTQSILMRYDAANPFGYGTNPKPLIELGEKYQQTRPRAAVTDGKLVYVTSDSAYNHLGGALAVIDPATDEVDVYHHLIKDQDLPTLCHDPKTGLLWGGTNRWGQMRSHPPTQESALVYVFDPQTREVVHTLTPWSGIDEARVLGASSNGIVVATDGQEIALIDSPTREVVYQGPLPIPLPGRICRGAEGASYCLSGGTLYRWDLGRNTLTPVATSPGCIHLSHVSGDTWALATSTSVYRVRLDGR